MFPVSTHPDSTTSSSAQQAPPFAPAFSANVQPTMRAGASAAHVALSASPAMRVNAHPRSVVPLRARTAPGPAPRLPFVTTHASNVQFSTQLLPERSRTAPSTVPVTPRKRQS